MDPTSNRGMGYSSAQPVPIVQGGQPYPPVAQGGQPYPPPAVQPIPNQVGAAIIVNQGGGGVAQTANTSKPFAATCPGCGKGIMTNSVRTCNCCTCLLCYCTGIIFFLCIQACRGKDFCCYDAVHSCPECGRTIASYNSC